MAKGYLKEAMHLAYGGNVGFRPAPPLPEGKNQGVPYHGSPTAPQPEAPATGPAGVPAQGAIPPRRLPVEEQGGDDYDHGEYTPPDTYSASRLGYGEGASGSLGSIGSIVGLFTGIPGLGLAGNYLDSERAERGTYSARGNVYGTQHTGAVDKGLYGAVSYDPKSGDQATGGGFFNQDNPDNPGSQFKDGTDKFGRSAAGYEGLGTHTGYQSIADLTGRNVKGFAPESQTSIVDTENQVAHQTKEQQKNVAEAYANPTSDLSIQAAENSDSSGNEHAAAESGIGLDAFGGEGGDTGGGGK